MAQGTSNSRPDINMRKNRKGIFVLSPVRPVADAFLRPLGLNPFHLLGGIITAAGLWGGTYFITHYMGNYESGSTESVLIAPKAVISSEMRAQIDLAKQIMLSPVSAEEQKARPFVDRILKNDELTQILIDIAATNHTSMASMMHVVAAETSGDAKNFKPNIIGARTAMQIMPDQFIRLLGTYGAQYAERMRVYAASQPDRAEEINQSADELTFIAQFVERVPDTLRFSLNETLYNQSMKQTMQGTAYPSLQQQIDKLYANGYVSMGMQDLSNAKDSAELTRQLAARKIAPPQNPERIVNYLGSRRAGDLLMLLNSNPNAPVIGNLMDEKTAKNNHAAYRMKKITVDGKLVEVPETHQITVKVEVRDKKHRKHTKLVHEDVPTQLSIAEMYQRQIGPHDAIYQGFRASYDREWARRLLKSQGIEAPKT